MEARSLLDLCHVEAPTTERTVAEVGHAFVTAATMPPPFPLLVLRRSLTASSVLPPHQTPILTVRRRTNPTTTGGGEAADAAGRLRKRNLAVDFEGEAARRRVPGAADAMERQEKGRRRRQEQQQQRQQDDDDHDDHDDHDAAGGLSDSDTEGAGREEEREQEAAAIALSMQTPSARTGKSGGLGMYIPFYDLVAHGVFSRRAALDVATTLCPALSAVSAGEFVAVAWHPFALKFAVGTRKDEVVFHDVHKAGDAALYLSHPLQDGVTTLSWHPLGLNVLAVGCRRGVCLWDTHGAMEPNGGKAALVVLQVAEAERDGAVLDMCWSPGGRLLAVTMAASNAVVVWDVVLQSYTTLSHSFGQAATLLRFSPSGRYLLVTSAGHSFRVWDTSTWTSQALLNEEGWCRDACWAPTGSGGSGGAGGEVLLMACGARGVIDTVVVSQPTHVAHYAVAQRRAGDDGRGFVNSNGVYSSGSSNRAERESGAGFSVRQVDSNHVRGWSKCPAGARAEAFGGEVAAMAWDPHAQRLAVAFATPGHSVVAVFATWRDPRGGAPVSFSPVGFVQTCKPTRPDGLCFQRHFDGGALLSLFWRDGTISLVPLYF